MRRLPFQYWSEGPIHWARFVSDDAPPVREHWPGLTDSDAIDTIDAAQWHRLAINNNNTEEVAVYLRIAWAILQQYEVLGNAYYGSGDAATALGQTGTVVAWQFETDAQGPPGHVAVMGFTPARSCVPIRPRPSDHERWMRDKTLLFRIRDFTELSRLLRSVLCDAAGEVSLLGTTEAGAIRITEQLRGLTAPRMEALLEAQDALSVLASA